MLSTQVLWCFAATPHEIATAGLTDNIEQHQRRKHSELDNILQIKSWIDGMSIQTKGKLDPSKTVDVLKYALILGNPLNPAFIEPWLLPLLKGAPPTFDNKLKAVTDTSGVTQKFLVDSKATIAHPEINTFKKLVMRSRAVRGFEEWHLLHKLVLEEVGGFNQYPIGLRPFPLAPASLYLIVSLATPHLSSTPSRFVCLAL